MSRAYAEIAFTPTVRAVQQRLGSRTQYAFLDEDPERGDRLGEREAAFIESRDSLFQATVGESGWPYVQHRGGPVGFLKVLDAKTIAFPDFRGNVQYISVGNLMRDDRIAIILMDHARQRRLKLFGRVELVDADADASLIAALHLPDYPARVERAFRIHVEGFDWNCPQHITPRYTESEIEPMVAPLKARAERAERRLTELEASASAHGTTEGLGRGPLELVVTGVRQLTPRVRAIELRDPRGQVLPEAPPGAHLAVPVRLPDGREDVRHYSITHVSDEGRCYEIAVLREDTGRGGSAFVHRRITLGSRLRCGLPLDRFPLGSEPGAVVLLAGGIGITPLRSMATALRRQGRRFELHYAVRSRCEAAYRDELAQALGDCLHLYPDEEGQRVDLDPLLRRMAHDDAVLYVCGPPGLIDAVQRKAAALDIDPSRVRSERFVAPANETPSPACEVRLHRSGRTVQVAAGQSVLDAIELAGVAAPASCRIGVCGTCAVTVLEGTVDHRDEVLTPAQHAAGRMCPCVSRSGGASLTLDL